MQSLILTGNIFHWKVCFSWKVIAKNEKNFSLQVSKKNFGNYIQHLYFAEAITIKLENNYVYSAIVSNRSKIFVA